MKIDNSTNKKYLLTEEYPIAKLKEIKQKAENTDILLSNFKKDFNVQCIRRTFQGDYVVLMLEDGYYAYVFFNEESKLENIIIANEFKSKTEFTMHVMNSTLNEVLKYDPNSILIPISAIDSTVHIVREGVFIVKYSRFINDQFTEDPVVSSVEFIANDDIMACGNPYITDMVPYILELDKTLKKSIY